MILNGIVVGAVLETFTIPPFRALSDRIGRKPMYSGGAVLSATLASPIFCLLDTKDPFIITIAMAVALE